MKICSKCEKEFDLMKYGYPGNPYRRVCWECEPPTYAKATGRYAKVISEDELDAMENRCLRDEEV